MQVALPPQTDPPSAHTGGAGGEGGGGGGDGGGGRGDGGDGGRGIAVHTKVTSHCEPGHAVFTRNQYVVTPVMVAKVKVPVSATTVR